MKYLKQIIIIMGISFVGEILKWAIPFKIPSSIYGLIIMFVLLNLKVIKTDQIRETANFFIDIMPIMFLPACVSLIIVWQDLKSFLLPLICIIVVSTFLVMGLSGKITDLIIDREKKNVK